jgi:hypothetical protein
MKVEIADPLPEGYERTLNVESPGEIEELVRSLSWEELSAVKVWKHESDWIECSGSHEDKFSIVYKGKQDGFITANPVESVDEMVTVLREYCRGGEEWKEMFSWEDFPVGDTLGGQGCGPLAVVGAFALVGLIVYVMRVVAHA